MTNELETIREALHTLVLVPSRTARKQAELALAALDRLAANTLDLGAVPEGWRFFRVILVRSGDLASHFAKGRTIEVSGADPTPSAALTAAIERTKEANGG